jgi:hypothetical protein
MGSSSAVGFASTTSLRLPYGYAVAAHCRNLRRSPFAMPPIGLMSAEEQSYFVMYPRRASSTFALPSTSSQDPLPVLPRTHGSSCASRYENTMRRRAWMFWRARFSVWEPPCTLYCGVRPVSAVNVVSMAEIMLSMLTCK